MLGSFFGDLGYFLKRHWRIVILPPLVSILLLLLANATFYAVSSRPSSCLTCHYMEPYYRQWKTSSHASVTCIECHKFRATFITVATIKYLTGTYAPRPRARVDDESCLKGGCHGGLLENGRARFKNRIEFDHKDHLAKLRRGVHLRCTSCHSQIVQGKHIAVTEKVCFLCHFRGSGASRTATGCVPCHGYPTKLVRHEGFAFSHESYLKLKVPCEQCHAEVAHGKGEVHEERCWSCHVERTWNGKSPYFVHSVHVTANGIDCFRCHEPVSHGGFGMARTLSVECRSCHTRRHSPEKELYMGVGGRGVPDTPSRMFAAQVACDGCHGTRMPEGRGGGGEQEDLIVTAKRSCVICHGEGYDGMLDDWMRELPQAAAETARVVEQAERARAGGRVRKDLEHLIEDARANVDLVLRGRAVHNVDYALKLLAGAWDGVEMALKEGAGEGAFPERPPILAQPALFCTLLCHDRMGLPQTVSFAEMNIDFPHSLHATDLGLDCTTCHSREKHQMRIISKEGCMGCHHGPEEEGLGCAHCHRPQDLLYRGKVQIPGVKAVPDPMAAAELPCESCHDLSLPAQSIQAIKESCTGCHEETYAKMLIDWERDLLERENRLTLQLDEVERELARLENVGRANEQATGLAGEAKRAYEAVTSAKGVHNYELSVALFDRAEELLARASELVRSSQAGRE